jgi:Cu+-exporting ATPase
VIETIRFPIEGMTCCSCVNRITRVLRTVDGVEQVRIDLRAETGTVRRDPLVAPDRTLVAAIAAAGYEADLAAAVALPTVARPGLASRLAARLRSSAEPCHRHY